MELFARIGTCLLDNVSWYDHQAYAIMVHRNYADRVQHALKRKPGLDVEWPKIFVEDLTMNYIEEVTKQSDLTIETPFLKGGRKERRGFILLIILDSLKPPRDLHPLARQQIAWAARLTTRLTFSTHNDTGISDDKEQISKEILDELVIFIYTKLATMNTKSRSSHETVSCKQVMERKIRIDTFPESLAVKLIEDLQQLHHQSKSSSTELAFMDQELLNLTKSAKLSDIVITVIKHDKSKNQIDFFVGITSSKEHFLELNDFMNQNAKGHVLVVPPKFSSCDDSEYARIPVSRAYYKLKQVCEEHLPENDLRTFRDSIVGVGLDIGASPGGWTQVLKNVMGVPTVICIDPGHIASRVKSLPGVIHVPKSFSSEDILPTLVSHAPFSMIVCDACEDNYSIFSILLETFRKTQRIRGDEIIFTLPSLFVVTLKFPYKTASSIFRNLSKVLSTLSDFVESISAFAKRRDSDHVVTRCHVLHLMANSQSERTVLIRLGQD